MSLDFSMEFPIAVEVVLFALVVFGLKNQRLSKLSGGLTSIAIGIFEFITFGLGIGISHSGLKVSLTNYYSTQVFYPIYVALAVATAVFGVWLIRQKAQEPKLKSL